MMRWTIFLTVAALALTVALPAFAQEDIAPGGGAAASDNTDIVAHVPRLPEVTILLHTGNQFGSGSMVLAVSSADDVITEDLSAVRFVDIRVCDQPHVFAVDKIAPAGQALGATTLIARSGTMSLSDVTAALNEACIANHLSVTSDELGANMVVPAAVTPPPVVQPDLANCPDGTLECDIIAQKENSGQETQ